MYTKIGSQFFSYDSFGAGVQLLIDPASNVAGVYVTSLTYSSGSGGAAIYTGATAPSSFLDNTKPTISFKNDNLLWGQFPYPFYLPAGNGLWQATAPTGGSARLTYDLLT
jgi:hypothetical protein